jgi:hypothetical protein
MGKIINLNQKRHTCDLQGLGAASKSTNAKLPKSISTDMAFGFTNPWSFFCNKEQYHHTRCKNKLKIHLLFHDDRNIFPGILASTTYQHHSGPFYDE